MRYRRLDENGDYTFGNGFGNFLVGRIAAAQSIKTKLLLFMGEWFLNLNAGLPMWQAIMSYAGSNKEAVDRIILDYILAMPVVSSVTTFSSSYTPSSRVYACVAEVETIYGTVTITAGG